MTKHSFFTLTCLLMWAFLGCERAPDAIPTEEPLNVEKPEMIFVLEDVKTTKATVKAEITRPGNLNILGYGCVWAIFPNPTAQQTSNKIEFMGAPSSSNFSFQIEGLNAETEYFIRTYIILAKDTLNFNQYTFLTKSHWTLLTDAPYAPSDPAAFFLGELAYFGAGFPNLRNFYAFDPATNEWESRGSLPQSDFGYNGVSAFTIQDTGYFGIGTNFNTGAYVPLKSFWAYTAQTGWSKRADFGGEAREAGVSFSINGIG